MPIATTAIMLPAMTQPLRSRNITQNKGKTKMARKAKAAPKRGRKPGVTMDRSSGGTVYRKDGKKAQMKGKVGRKPGGRNAKYVGQKLKRKKTPRGTPVFATRQAAIAKSPVKRAAWSAEFQDYAPIMKANKKISMAKKGKKMKPAAKKAAAKTRGKTAVQTAKAAKAKTGTKKVTRAPKKAQGSPKKRGPGRPPKVAKKSPSSGGASGLPE